MCFYNKHNFTSGTGITPAVINPGKACDCGEMMAYFDSATNVLITQYTSTGQLLGR